jgi:hydroxymethylpyrimidine/phosphomethylpyrimidine kinase
VPDRIPNVLTIAGVDPSGGAGVLADVKTISALGAYACAVVAALTAQNTRAVTGIFGIPPAFVREQIDTLFADVRIDAVKIGMVGGAPVIRAVADGLTHWKPQHVVLDPVMVAKSGDALLEPAAVGALLEALVPLATVLTPNLPEAGVLLGQRGPETIPEMRRAAEKLRERMTHAGSRWVVLKGGHLPGGDAVDVVTDGDRMLELGTNESTRATRMAPAARCRPRSPRCCPCRPTRRPRSAARRTTSSPRSRRPTRSTSAAGTGRSTISTPCGNAEDEAAMRNAALPVTLIVVGIVGLIWYFGWFPDRDTVVAIGLIAAGVLVLAMDGLTRSSVVLGPTLITMGVMWWLHDQYHLRWSLLIPILLIVIGALMLVARRGSFPERRGKSDQ